MQWGLTKERIDGAGDIKGDSPGNGSYRQGTRPGVLARIGAYSSWRFLLVGNLDFGAPLLMYSVFVAFLLCLNEIGSMNTEYVGYYYCGQGLHVPEFRGEICIQIKCIPMI